MTTHTVASTSLITASLRARARSRAPSHGAAVRCGVVATALALFGVGCGETSCPAGSVAMGGRCFDESALEGDSGAPLDADNGARDGSIAIDASRDAAEPQDDGATATRDATAPIADAGSDAGCASGQPSPDGGCVDDPCLPGDGAPAPCDVNATCTSEAGAAHCQCNDGYLGDGESCVEDGCVPEPGEPPVCGAHASCTADTEGAPNCACDAGYGDCNDSVHDGCEQSLSADTANCGACGRVCASGLACMAGECQERVTHIGVGFASSYFRRADGVLLGAGFGLSAAQTASRIPVQVSQAGVLRAYPYYNHTCATRGEAHSALCWGTNNDDLQVGASSAATLSFELGEPARSICAGDKHSCMVTLAGRVRCWGSGASGAFGDGLAHVSTKRSYADSTLVPDVTGAVEVVCGRTLNCALTSKREVFCWGSDKAGTNYPPELVRDTSAVKLTDAVALSGGNDHACAVREGGSVVCWGEGDNGRLGGPAAAQKNRYTTVDIEGVKSVACGAIHSCALLDDGEVRCWGGGAQGALGIGDTSDQQNPIEPSLPYGYVATGVYSGPVIAGTCVTLDTGHVYCWGYDYYGQLGVDGNMNYHSAPVEVIQWP